MEYRTEEGEWEELREGGLEARTGTTKDKKEKRKNKGNTELKKEE